MENEAEPSVAFRDVVGQRRKKWYLLQVPVRAATGSVPELTRCRHAANVWARIRRRPLLFREG